MISIPLKFDSFSICSFILYKSAYIDIIKHDSVLPNVTYINYIKWGFGSTNP